MESLRKQNFEKALNELNIPFLLENHVIIIEKVGEGGFGEVFRGKYGDFDVAIKKIKFDLYYEESTDVNIYDILLNEIQVIITANSIGIPKFYGLWRNDNHYHLISEFIFGKSLKQCYKEMDKKTKLEIIRDFLEILAELHDHKLIHRDIKPDNIMIEKGTNRPRLIDFGVSKIARKTSTFTNMQMGTVPYMSPEMFYDEDDSTNDQNAKTVPVSIYCDIWSTGVMISEIFSGIKPWKKNEESLVTDLQIQACFINRKKFPVPAFIDKDIKELIECAVQVDSHLRPNARELQEKVKIILEGLN